MDDDKVFSIILEEIRMVRDQQAKDRDALKSDIKEMREELSGLFRNGPITQLQKCVSALKVKVWILLTIGGFLAALLISHVAMN